MTRVTSYTDAKGRRIAVLLPDGVSDVNAPMGIRIGPPNIDRLVEELGVPEPAAIRLHNQLFDRGLLTARDAELHPQEITGAIISAYRLDSSELVRFLQMGDDWTPR